MTTDNFLARISQWRDPGALYNLGNVIGFSTGLGVAVLAAEGAGMVGFLAGSPAALCMTLATAIFFWGGLVYSRAWAYGAPPIARLNRAGDLWSAAGAVVLGLGLLLVGDPILAATAGALHATGKLGSAVAGTQTLSVGRSQISIEAVSKDVVLLSRLPAFAAALAGLDGGVTSISFLMCTAIWAVADWTLLAPSSMWLRVVRGQGKRRTLR